MKKILERFGELIHRIMGPSKTLVFQGEQTASSYRLHLDSGDMEVTLLSRRVVYHTQRVRKWIPDTKRNVYLVSGLVKTDDDHRLTVEAIQEVAFPMLSNVFLKWSDIPHHIAIDAYLDRMLHLLTGRGSDATVVTALL